MIKLDAYNISFMLMDAWRKCAMSISGTGQKIGTVPTFVEINGELKEVTDVVEVDGKIILKTQ